MDCSISIFGGFMQIAPESLRNEMVLHLKIKNEFSNYRMQKEWKISQMLISISTTCSLKESWMSGLVWIYLLSKILPPLRPTPGALLRPSGASMRFSRTEQLQILKMWRQILTLKSPRLRKLTAVIGCFHPTQEGDSSGCYRLCEIPEESRVLLKVYHIVKV